MLAGQVRHHFARQQVGRLDVGVEIPLQFLPRGFQQTLRHADGGAGVVDQDVRAAEFLDGPPDQQCGPFGRGNVGRDAEGGPAVPFDGRLHFAGCGGLAAVGDSHLDAAGGEGAGDAGPDAPAGAGDDRHRPLQRNAFLFFQCHDSGLSG